MTSLVLTLCLATILHGKPTCTHVVDIPISGFTQFDSCIDNADAAISRWKVNFHLQPTDVIVSARCTKEEEHK